MFFIAYTEGVRSGCKTYENVIVEEHPIDWLHRMRCEEEREILITFWSPIKGDPSDFIVEELMASFE